MTNQTNFCWVCLTPEPQESLLKETPRKTFDHQIKKIDIQVKGQYALSHLKEIALLPDFCNSHTIEICACEEEETIGRHDVILGICFSS